MSSPDPTDTRPRARTRLAPLRAVTVIAAVGIGVLLIGCEPVDDQTSQPHKPLRKGDHVGAPGQIEKPSCDEVSGPRGIRGRVIGSEWVDPDGVTCLEIDPKGGRPRLVRVSRRVFDRCVEGDRYPQCATGTPR